MYARVNEFTGSAEQLEQGLSETEAISREVDEMPGSLGMYYLIDRAGGKAMAITLWETEEAMRSSESAAADVRERSSRAQGTAIAGVGHYEVAANTARVAAARE